VTLFKPLNIISVLLKWAVKYEEGKKMKKEEVVLAWLYTKSDSVLRLKIVSRSWVRVLPV